MIVIKLLSVDRNGVEKDYMTLAMKFQEKYAEGREEGLLEGEAKGIAMKSCPEGFPNEEK